jgi:hypothetical protein
MDDHDLLKRLIAHGRKYGAGLSTDNEAWDAIERLQAREATLIRVLEKIESGECVTDWADQPHEQMQDAAREARATIGKEQA